MTNDFGLENAYSLESADDVKNLYRQWAKTFDDEFLVGTGYVYDERVAEAFVAAGTLTGTDAVLDVGCGTGVGGVQLRTHGPWPVDGFDLSPEMLEQARAKVDPSGEPVYRHLIEGDVLAPLALPDDSYGGAISVGTFTHGHVGPEAIDNIVEVVRPGGLIVLGINEEFFIKASFAAHFERLVGDGLINEPELTQVRIYDAEPGAHDHATDTALVATFVAAD